MSRIYFFIFETIRIFLSEIEKNCSQRYTVKEN